MRRDQLISGMYNLIVQGLEERVEFSRKLSSKYANVIRVRDDVGTKRQRSEEGLNYPMEDLGTVTDRLELYQDQAITHFFCLVQKGQLRFRGSPNVLYII